MTVVAWFVTANTIMVVDLYELLCPFPLSNASIYLHFAPMHAIPYHVLDNSSQLE
jgi:hypothetical protein